MRFKLLSVAVALLRLPPPLKQVHLLLRLQFRQSPPMALSRLFRSITAAVAAWSARLVVVVLRIVAGGMIAVDGIAIHHVIIVNAIGIDAGAVIATIVAKESISSHVVAAHIIKRAASSLLLYTVSVCVSVNLSSCGKTSGVIGAKTSMINPLGAKFKSQSAFNSPVSTE